MDKKTFRLLLICCGAWSVLQVGHEMLGHGLTVLIVGGKPLSVNAMYFHHDLSSVSDLADRWIRAGGSIFNVLWALVCLLLLVKKWCRNYEVNYFLWVSCVINFLQSGSYIAFGRFINEGMDWAMVIDGLEHQKEWGYVELGVGILLLLSGTYVALRFGNSFTDGKIIGSNRKLYWLPLFSATILSVTSSLILPTNDRFMMLMGGIGNGFTFLLPLFVLGFFKMRPKKEFQTFVYRPNHIMVLFAVMVSVFYLFIMSPGIHFN